MLNVAGRLPGTLKRRYRDFLARFNFDLNYLGLDDLRKFVVHELCAMPSDQNFFQPNSIMKPRDSGQWRGPVSIRQVGVKQSGGPKDNYVYRPDANKIHKRIEIKNLKALSQFLCVLYVMILFRRHFLANWHYLTRIKKTNSNAGRRVNCFFARDSTFNCSRITCGPKGMN